MLNSNDKKFGAVIFLLLIIIVGSLVFIRGCDKKEFKNDDIFSKDAEVVPDENEENPSQSSDYESNVDSDTDIYRVLSENKEISKVPVLDFEDYYQVEMGNKDFRLPLVSEVDGNGNRLAVIITYYFKSIYANDYTLVDGLSFTELGTYKVHYQVTNSYGKTAYKALMIEVVDQTAPIIEGYIEEYDISSGLISYIPVNNNAIINDGVKINFSDNGKIVYANYYKALYEVVGGINTLEQESLMNVMDIDLTTDFYLYDDGEYHIRAYDEANNYTEYIVTIDRSNPVIEINYTKLNTNQVLVTIKADEMLSEVSGFTLSEDKKTLTKVYTNNCQEEIIISDLAGNKVNVSVLVDTILEVKVLQNGIQTESTQLNLNDGVISIIVEGNSNYEINYRLDYGSSISYTNGINLVVAGHYDFTITGDMGIINFSLDISNQLTGG